MNDEAEGGPLELDSAGWSESELRSRLAELAGETRRVAISGSERAGFLAGLNTTLRITVQGVVGDFCLAMIQAGEVRIHGAAGAGLGEGMAGGSIRIRGSAGLGCGVAIKGGTLAVYGDVGDHLGVAMQGGEIFVRGDVGAAAGAYGQRGTLVIGGDAGERLAFGAQEVTVYLRGRCPEIGRSLVEKPLTKADQLKLGLVLINAGIKGAPVGFRRIVPMARH
jgi:glutamate synthase domain-containing protein 3